MVKTRFPKEIEFYFDHDSEGARHQGRFVVKRPNIMEQMEVEGEKSRILKGHYYDPSNPGRGIPLNYAVMAEMMAFLKVAIVEAPEWWDDGDVYDPEIIAKIYDEAQVVDPFRSKVAKPQGAGEAMGGNGGGGDNQRDDAISKDSVAEMVSTEI